MEDIKAQLKSYDESNDREAFRIILNAADQFIAKFPNGVQTQDELAVGIELVRRLVSASLVSSTREYENDHKLYREFVQKKIKVFKRCITEPTLRGVTELLFGMKENELK